MTAKRMWVNQPSTSQPLHHLHGTLVLAVPESYSPQEMIIYFLSGPIISQQASSLWLSDGWPEQLQIVDAALKLQAKKIGDLEDALAMYARIDKEQLATITGLQKTHDEFKRIVEGHACNNKWEVYIGEPFSGSWHTVNESEYQRHAGRKRHSILLEDSDPEAALRDHQIRDIVNQVRDIAVGYSHTQQLRDRLAQVLVPVLKGESVKITLEVEMDDTDKIEAVARRFSNVASYAAGFIGTCVVKAGRMEVHETGVFNLMAWASQSDASNVKITIDRS